MSRSMRALMAVFGVQLVCILVLLHLLQGSYAALGVAKYTVITSIVVASALVRGRTPLHRPLAMAFVFLWVGDFFLIFVGVLPGVSPDDRWVHICGMVGFLIAYLCLLKVYWKRPSLGRSDGVAALPVLAIGVPVVVLLWPDVSGGLRIWALVFTLGVGTMAWFAICTLHRGFYRPTIARRFAAAGLLIFLSDMGVGFSFFYPELHRNLPWLGFEIWITYVPAWCLLLLNLAEDDLQQAPVPAESP